MAQTKGGKPTHGVFHVREGKSGRKGFWTRIGAAWMHDDSKGLSVVLDLVPVGEGKIVIRLNDAENDADTATSEVAA